MADTGPVTLSDSAVPKLFRQTLFWPLRLQRQGGRDSEAFDPKAFVALMCGSRSSPWKECEDLIRRAPDTPEKTAYAEQVYFHPFVQEFLYASGAQASMRLLERKDVRRVEAVLWNSFRKEVVEVCLAVDRVHLYVFDLGLAILTVEWHWDESIPIRSGGAERPALLSDIQEMVNRLRRAYPASWGGEADNPFHCPDRMDFILDDGTRLSGDFRTLDLYIDFAHQHNTALVAGHWLGLLDPLRQQGQIAGSGYGFAHIIDDRIPFMTYLAVDDPKRLTDGDFVRLCFADESGCSSERPYSKAILEDFEKNHCYDRFWEVGNDWMTTRYLLCGYGFTCIGKHEEVFFSNEKDGALAHFRHHYFQLGLVVHLLRSALLMLEYRLSSATKRLESPPKDFFDDAHAIHRDLLVFSGRYWSSEVSTQTQGTELFDAWSRHLRLNELYELVVQEVKDTTSYLDVGYDREMSSKANKFALLATLLVILGLIVGFWGINFIGIGEAGAGPEGERILFPVKWFWLSLGGAALLPILGSFGLYFWQRCRK